MQEGHQEKIPELEQLDFQLIATQQPKYLQSRTNEASSLIKEKNFSQFRLGSPNDPFTKTIDQQHWMRYLCSNR